MEEIAYAKYEVKKKPSKLGFFNYYFKFRI
jgi:hypothetical protein